MPVRANFVGTVDVKQNGASCEDLDESLVEAPEHKVATAALPYLDESLDEKCDTDEIEILNAPLDELMQQFEVLHLDVMAQASELNTLSAEDEDEDGETEMFSDSVMESVEQGKISLLLADDAIVAANSVSWLQAIPADGDNKPEDGVWGHMVLNGLHTHD